MKFPKPLQQALAAAELVMQRRTKIRSEIARAQSEVEADKARIPELLERLGAAEADFALGQGSSQTVLQSNRKALRDLRDGIEAAEAKIQGLTLALDRTNAEAIKAEAELSRSRDEFARATREQYAAELAEAAKPLIQVVRRGIGLSKALGLSFFGLEEFKVPHPAEPGRKLAEAIPRHHEEGRGWLPDFPEEPKAIGDMRRVHEALMHETKELPRPPAAPSEGHSMTQPFKRPEGERDTTVIGNVRAPAVVG